jgi:hypothetical protein
MTYKSRRSASHLNGRATGVARWKYFVKRENRVLRGIATENPALWNEPLSIDLLLLFEGVIILTDEITDLVRHR